MTKSNEIERKTAKKIESEKLLERKLFEKVKAKGGDAIKMMSQYHRGLPDRLVLFKGRAAFVEVKTTGKKPTKLQMHTKERLERLGFEVYVIDNSEAIDDFINNFINR